MTYCKIFGLFVLITRGFSSLAMEDSGVSNNDISYREYYVQQAKIAIKIYDLCDYHAMHKYILSKCSSANQFYDFNMICKHIAWEQNNLNIFAHELSLICSNHANKKTLCTFFELFNNKLKLNTITALLENETEHESSQLQVDLLCAIVINIAISLNEVNFTCNLARRMLLHKNFLMREYFKEELSLEELINCSLLQVLRKLCGLLSNMALSSTTKFEQDYINCRPLLKKNVKKILKVIFLGRQKKNIEAHASYNYKLLTREELLASIFTLSENDRSDMVKYLFSHFLVVHPDYLSASLSINKKISLIYDNHEKPIYGLEYNELKKRVRDLADVLNFFKVARPNVILLSKSIKDPNVLGPMAKSIYYLNNYMMECIVAKIIQDIIKGKALHIKYDLKFLIKKLGPNFFKKALLIIEKKLEAIIKQSKNHINAEIINCGSVTETLSKAVYVLGSEKLISPQLLNDISKISINLQQIQIS